MEDIRANSVRVDASSAGSAPLHIIERILPPDLDENGLPITLTDVPWDDTLADLHLQTAEDVGIEDENTVIH